MRVGWKQKSISLCVKLKSECDPSSPLWQSLWGFFWRNTLLFFSAMEITPHFLSSCVKSCFIYLYGCTLDFCSLFLQPCLRKRHQLRFACSVWPLFISLLRMQEQKGSGALGISLCGILQLPVWWGGRSSFWICRGNALPHGTELGQVCTPTT